MEKNEFNDKIKKYYSLNEQVKKMTKVKKKLNDELKEEIRRREESKVSILGYRAVVEKKTREYPKNEKIKKFLLKSEKKISDYYKKTDFYTLYVMKTKSTLSMENINE